MNDRGLIAICATVFLMGPAFAQGRVNELPAALSSTFAQVAQAQAQTITQAATVRVQSTISYFVPGPTHDSDDAQKLRDRARRQIYDAAARECDVLKETLAKDCRLESVNSNTNASRQYGPGQQEGFTINGSMSFQITLK